MTWAVLFGLVWTSILEIPEKIAWALAGEAYNSQIPIAIGTKNLLKLRSICDEQTRTTDLALSSLHHLAHFPNLIP